MKSNERQTDEQNLGKKDQTQEKGKREGVICGLPPIRENARAAREGV